MKAFLNKRLLMILPSTYLQGGNPILVFDVINKSNLDLLTTARDLGAEALVTGHYVQRLNPWKNHNYGEPLIIIAM